MKGFNIDIKKEDILGYISDNTKLKIPESLKSKNSKEEGEKEDDNFENLTSMRSQTKKLENTITKRVVTVIIVVPLTLFVMTAIHTTYKTLQAQSQRKVAPEIKEQDLDLKVDSSLKWKMLKDQEMQKLTSNVANINNNVKEEIKVTTELFNKRLKENELLLTDSITEIRKDILTSQELLIDKIDGINKNQSLINKKIEMQKNSLIKKIDDAKTVSQKQTAYFMPDIPPLKKRISADNKLKSFDKNVTFISSNEFNESKTKTIATTGEDARNIKSEEDMELYEEVFEDITENTIAYSSLNTEDEYNSSKEKALPQFKLMAGFVKGTLLNGGEVPVLLDGGNDAVPIYIKVDGDQLIANGASVNIDGCIILATSKGDLSKHSIDMRLSSISCDITDLDDNHYAIEKGIAGWVFGESGSYGLEGRVVSREKDIIKAGLPIALIESLVQALAVAAQPNTNSAVLLTNETVSRSEQMQQGALQGASSSIGDVLSKFSDYYLKLLDSLKPNISIRAGRKVTIAFKGGEMLQMVKYEPINTTYFEDEVFEEDYEDE